VWLPRRYPYKYQLQEQRSQRGEEFEKNEMNFKMIEKNNECQILTVVRFPGKYLAKFQQFLQQKGHFQ